MPSTEREVTPFTSAEKATSAAARGSGYRPVVSDHLEAQRGRNRACARTARGGPEPGRQVHGAIERGGVVEAREWREGQLGGDAATRETRSARAGAEQNAASAASARESGRR
jgi:hypothetical protein